MKKVLVAGATGYLGGFVVKELKRQGYYVKILARDDRKADSLREFVDEIHIGEITNPDTIKGICNDIDIVFSSIGITRQKDSLTYWDVDFQGNVNLLNEALQCDVRKFLYVSSLNADKMQKVKITKAKQAFVKELQKSGLNHTILYPNGFFSDMLEVLHMAKKGKGYIFGKGDCRLNPIHGEDLAEVCVNAIKTTDKEIEVGGPDVFTQREIFEIAFQALDKEPKISSVPDWVRKFSVWFLRTFTSVKKYGPVEFFMTAMSMDMVAPTFGRHHLFDFYVDEARKLEETKL